MNISQLIADIVKAISDSEPLPSLSDRASVKAWLGKLLPDLVDLAYDSIQNTPAPVKPSLQAFSTAEVERLVENAAPGATPEWVQNVIGLLPSIISLIEAIGAILATK